MCEARQQQRRPQAQPARTEVNRRGFLQGSAPAPGDNPKGGDSGAPREVRLKGLTLFLGPPRVVVESSVGHCWYPDLLKFSSGALMLTYSLNADSNVNLHNSQ